MVAMYFPLDKLCHVMETNFDKFANRGGKVKIQWSEFGDLHDMLVDEKYYKVITGEKVTEFKE